MVKINQTAYLCEMMLHRKQSPAVLEAWSSASFASTCLSFWSSESLPPCLTELAAVFWVVRPQVWLISWTAETWEGSMSVWARILFLSVVRGRARCCACFFKLRLVMELAFSSAEVVFSSAPSQSQRLKPALTWGLGPRRRLISLPADVTSGFWILFF